MSKPLCFVLMPFGKKPQASGSLIDFDAVYHDLIAPAIEAADLQPLRADEEMAGGIIHKPMFERLILCEYAVADMTTANANVFYELGVRHAVRPSSTVLLFGAGTGQLPFDVALLRAIPYELTKDGKPANPDVARDNLAARLKEARKAGTDSPIFQLVDGFPDIQRLKTDVFREQVDYSFDMKQKLFDARKKGLDAILAIENEIGSIRDTEAGVIVDLFLSYRSVKGWKQMIVLAEKMPAELAATVMIREQLGLALNRDGRGDEAEKVLLDLIAQRGPSSETYGILGRIYKDRWEGALKGGQTALARGLIDKAIKAYLAGFESDWRDAYPGVNAATLMEVKDPPDPRREKLIPIVTYAVERRITAGKPDYWDYASKLELGVLSKDEEASMSALADALPVVREVWEPETTVRNLRLIREAREKRGDVVQWADGLEQELTNAASGFPK